MFRAALQMTAHQECEHDAERGLANFSKPINI
jgi:hypothetical protein